MTQLEQLKAIYEKQKEIIKDAFYQTGYSNGKLKSELSELEKIEIEEKKAFIDVAPPKDKVVCGNCKYFEQWGVVAGDCLHPDLDGESNRDENDTCHRFEKIEK